MQASNLVFVPIYRDALSVVEVPIATAWRVGRRPVRGSLGFSCPAPEQLERDGLLSHRPNTEDPCDGTSGELLRSSLL
jgi:hypothetical protein